MICNVESQHSAEITWRYYSENSLLWLSNAMHKYASFLFLVVFVCISESVRGCIIIIIHRVCSLLTGDSFCNSWENKDYSRSLPSHHQLRMKPLSHLWLYCSMTHTHTQQVCLCAERNDKWAPRFSVARLALRVSGPSALTVSPVKKKKKGLSEQICLLCLAVNSTDAVNYTLFAACVRAKPFVCTHQCYLFRCRNCTFL